MHFDGDIRIIWASHSHRTSHIRTLVSSSGVLEVIALRTNWCSLKVQSIAVSMMF